MALSACRESCPEGVPEQCMQGLAESQDEPRPFFVLHIAAASDERDICRCVTALLDVLRNIDCDIISFGLRKMQLFLQMVREGCHTTCLMWHSSDYCRALGCRPLCVDIGPYRYSGRRS